LSWRALHGADDGLTQTVSFPFGESRIGECLDDERERWIGAAGDRRRLAAAGRQPGAPAELVELRRRSGKRSGERFHDRLVRRMAIAALELGDVGVVHAGCSCQLADGQSALDA
jgi:hypothetical protein